MLLERLTNDVFHQPARVQAGVGVLEDHLDAAAHGLGISAFEGGVGVLPIKSEATARGVVQAHQQAGHGALATAGFAHQGQRLALLDLEAHTVHSVQQRAGFSFQHAVEPGGRYVEGLGQVVRLHQGLVCGIHGAAHAATLVLSAACSQQAARVFPALIRSGRSVMQRSNFCGQRGL